MVDSPDKFDVAVWIEPCLMQPDRDAPVTIAAEIADSNPLSLELLQRLDVRRAHPDVNVLVSPAGNDVEISASGTLIKHRARLHIEGDVDRFFLHRLRNPQFFQTERHH